MNQEKHLCGEFAIITFIPGHSVAAYMYTLHLVLLLFSELDGIKKYECYISYH